MKGGIVIGSKTLGTILAALVILGVFFYIFNKYLPQNLQVPTGQVQINPQINPPSLPTPSQVQTQTTLPAQAQQYATNIYGYVFAKEDNSPIFNVTVYASKEEPFEKYLFKNLAPPIVAQAKTASDGKFSMLVMPGDTWVWVWGADASPTRYPEVVSLVGSKAVPSLPPEQPSWTTSDLNIYLRKVGQFATIIEDVGTYGTTGWKVSFDGTNTYRVNLEGNGTAAQAGQIYDLYRHTGKYIYIQPKVSDTYLKDVKIAVSYVAETELQKFKDLRFIIVSNPGNVPVVVNNVPGSPTDSYVQFYGYIDAAYPIQMDLVLETATGVSFTDGTLALKIKIDDMRAVSFVGGWKAPFAPEQYIAIYE
jgi:hypothetical protein